MKQVLTLDYQASKLLQYYMVYNGDATLTGLQESDLYYFFFGQDPSYKYDLLHNDKEINILHKGYRIQYLYALLTLFDEINISRIQPGISYSHSILNCFNVDYPDIGISFFDEKPKLPRQKTLTEAENVFRFYLKNIIYHFTNDDSFRFLDGFPNQWIVDYYLENQLYTDAFTQKKKNLFKSILPFRNWYDEYESHLFQYFDRVFIGITETLCQKNGTLYSPIFDTSNLQKIEIQDCIDINNYIINADFTSGINLIPWPETLNDVCTLRQDSNLISFRTVFNQWISCLRQGDVQAFANMRNDVIKANENLRKLQKYRKIENSFYSRVFSCVGSLIPVINEILMGYGFITPFITDKIEKENEWCNLPAFKRIYKAFIYEQDGYNKSK